MALIGYMGRDDRAPSGLGEALLVDAARRVALIREHIAIWGLSLHSETNGRLAQWYEDQGFFRYERNQQHMYAPLSRFLSK